MHSVASKDVSDWLLKFDKALSGANFEAATQLFGDECYWRDFVAFSWNIITLEGRACIRDMLAANLSSVAPQKWTLIEGSAKTTGDVTEGAFSFETATARGKGYVRLKDGKCWTLMTSAAELKGFEEPIGPRRDEGIVHKAKKRRKSWLELKQKEEAELGYAKQPYCLIVGGSQGGLALGARLKRLGVPTIIVDALEKPGDGWRARYKSLYLHDPIWMDHLPYIPFPNHWPVYTSKDKMGDWLENYCNIMELDFWGNAPCEKATYDNAAKEWVVQVRRNGELVTLRPKQLILSTGLSGMKKTPKFPGADTFEGVQFHSADHPGGEQFEGKKCVVVGGNNSAHDIAVDLWENDADVTMIQRSSTTVVKVTRMRALGGYNMHYDAEIGNGIDQEMADIIATSLPFKLRTLNEIETTKKVQELDKEFYDRLRAVGFLLDFGEDGSGLNLKYMRFASGYYIDVGGSDLIADGEVKLKSGVGVSEIKSRSVVLTDGTELEADAIVYATGYDTMDSWAAQLISPEVADKVGPCWGLGSGVSMDPGPWEGELRNMWKPTKQEALWFHGGNLIQSRIHSLHLALQLKARMEGLPTPVYQSA